MPMPSPVIDLHCDLLAYLLSTTPLNPFDRERIGSSFPALAEGGVKLQVMAIFTPTKSGSTAMALRQSQIFQELCTDHAGYCYVVDDVEALDQLPTDDRLGMIAAIENASGICEEDEPLEKGLERLEQIISNTSRLLYVGLTHHPENRFGGGNNSAAGLKEDGKTLLQYLSGRKIAIDFSHASDALAYGMLEYIDQHNLDLPIIASHSNYREVFHHVRNLPDDLAKDIIKRKGLIGLNFLRAFVNNDDSNALYDHLAHGLQLGGAQAVCFGADYFCTDHHPDRSRVPFYYPEHSDATRYPAILATIADRVDPNLVTAMSSENVLRFMRRLWAEVDH